MLERMRDQMRAGFLDKFGDELEARGIDITDVIGEVSTSREPAADAGKVRPRARARGRPKFAIEELRQVAVWAQQARDESVNDGLAVYPKIAEKAATSGWRSFSVKHPPSERAVKDWIRWAKDAGVLAPDFIRYPRRKQD
ncbi:hypothetical protein A5735_04850 [Mycolicibacter heraklionensis]|nr:hypothetical protein A5735_04850 [Mycolicibacter heraklionensis]